MKRLALFLTLLFWNVAAYAGAPALINNSDAAVTALGYQPEQVINVTYPDWGAKCDGTTDDTAAINAALTAAFNSSAYSGNNAIHVVGPGNGAQVGCLYSGLNLTQFNKANGANLRPRVEFSNITLLCSGTGVDCMDAIKGTMIKVHDVSIRGNSGANAPRTCIQVGSADNSTSAAWHNFERVNCNNEFSFAAYYNVDSEANTLFDSMFANAHTSSGPVAAVGGLGSVTGGSGYANATYTNVPLTGGSCTVRCSPPLATVVVSGGAVTTVTITFQGFDLAVGDTLTASNANLGGSGSGFSVPVAALHPYVMVMDGQDHWRASSAYTTVTRTPDTWGSQTLVTMVGGSIRQLGNGGALWLGWNGGLRMVGSYILNNSGASCVELFDNGVTKSGIPGPNWGLDLEFNCEGSSLASAFNFTGSHTTLSYANLRWSGYHQGQTATFTSDSNITSVALPNVDLNVKFANGSGLPVPMFSSAKLYTVSGKVGVPAAENWNAPASFAGSLTVGTKSNVNSIVGPLDLLATSPALALSCDRRLTKSYTGPLCQMQRASDNATQDIYPNSIGEFDKNAFTSFCNGTTCAVRTAYDQSGNGNNCTQTTGANQPGLAFQSALNNRVAMAFGDASAIALSCTAAASINNLWNAGAYLSFVANQPSNSTTTNRVATKTQWTLLVPTSGAGGRFLFTGTPSGGGDWSTTISVALGAKVFDLQYSGASLSNLPVFGNNGTTVTSATGAATNPQATDNGNNLIIGNTTVTGGSSGYPGQIAEFIIWTTTPSAAILESIRRNQGVHYGLGAIVN